MEALPFIVETFVFSCFVYLYDGSSPCPVLFILPVFFWQFSVGSLCIPHFWGHKLFHGSTYPPFPKQIFRFCPLKSPREPKRPRAPFCAHCLSFSNAFPLPVAPCCPLESISFRFSGRRGQNAPSGFFNLHPANHPPPL